MQVFMATSTKGNQIRGVIVALLTAQLFVMNLQGLPRATELAFPAIAPQYLLSQLAV
jgi:hypothetical protein